MAKSDIMMGADEIAAMEAELDAPPAVAGEPERTAEPRQAKEPEPDFVFVPSEPEEEASAKGKPQAEPEKAADRAKKPEGERQETVPHKALHAEREEHKKTRAALETERAARETDRNRQTRLEERLNTLQEAWQRQAQPAPAAPEVVPVAEQNPVEAIAWTQRQIQAQRQQQAAQQRQQTQHAEQQRQAQARNQAVQQVVEEAQQEWAGFAAENPQANEAYDYLFASRKRELKAIHPRATDAQIVQAIRQEEVNALIAARQNGTAPSAIIMAYAEARGWKQPEAQPEPKTNGASEKLTALSKAHDASESLSTSGGSSPSGSRVSLESLDRMDEKEFTSMIARLSKRGEDGVDRALAKMMGVG